MAPSSLPEPWIAYPSANATAYGVYHFRRTVQFKRAPDRLVVHVSADNRYNLFVNGQRVCYGPAKGDLQTYKYDIIDIAPFLRAGDNILAALVYNGGQDKPLAFLSAQTAFMLRAENRRYARLDTDERWKTYKNPAYSVISYYEMLFKKRWFYGFYACGGGDGVAADRHPWGWEQADFADADWPAAEVLTFAGKAPWTLVPRTIAFVDGPLEQPGRVRLAEGVRGARGLVKGRQASVPARTNATLLIDWDAFTMGYPELTVDRGRGSAIKIRYAEALYDDVHLKAHRNAVRGKTMYGVWDIFRPDGQRRTFRPLWKRAFRYMQLEITTADEALDLLSLENEYSGYPYPELSTFASDDEQLDRIFALCLRTLRMCSGETYYDTPFYEQLSYGGDNRPIGALSHYNSTDDRLFREVMRLYPQSVNRETGLFKSAYPSRFDFDMGSWSLAWIQSLWDYYLLRGDADYARQFLAAIAGVLGFYRRHTDQSMGLLGAVKCQNFIDWSISKGSLPRSDENGEMKHSALLTLYYAHSLDCAALLYAALGEAAPAAQWRDESARIKAAVYAHCWDAQAQLFRDYPDQRVFSQHVNIMAILCDVPAPAAQQALLDQILDYKHFTERASSYFSFFLFKAFEKLGREDLLLSHLGFWHAFLRRGHTTAGETGFASHDRSDCHAWSAHPAYFLLRLVCGIKPADLGFEHVLIAPQLGHLRQIDASMPHPKGRIAVRYRIEQGKLHARITLPEGMAGTWQYGGEQLALKPGVNDVVTPR